MKIISTIILLITITSGANAQDKFDALKEREFMFDALHSAVAIIGIYLLSVFILTMIRLLMNFSLKKSLLEKGANEEVISQILSSDKSDYRLAIKWFVILTAIGIGLIAVSLFQPLGLHSVIIMTFSVALGFLGYYFIIRRLN